MRRRPVGLREGRRSVHLLFGTANIPHPAKLGKGGEDAFFADPATSTFGVADGVGGSARDGVDPGVFSRKMLSHCRQWLAANAHEQSSMAHLTKAMTAAGNALESAPVGGSSTLLLGALDSSTARLALVNIGDSAALLLRPAPRRFAKAGTVLWPRLVARTQEQTHYFNCPFQVGSSDMLEVVKGSADELQVQVRSGDIIVAATDGVTDNLFDQQLQGLIAAEVRGLLGTPDESARAVQSVANNLALRAVAVGKCEDDPETTTPFSVSARMEGYDAPGGKLDDVAVVVAVVREGERATTAAMASNFR